MTALYTTSGLVLSTFSQFAVGRWSDRRGRATPTYLFLSGMVLAPALAAVWHASTVGLFLTGIAGTACGWTMSVLVLGAVRQRTQASERGRAIGFIHMLWSFGFFLGSVTAGQLLDVHPAIPLGLAAFWNALALAAAVALYRGRADAPVEAPA